MSGLTHLSERAVEAAIEQIALGYSLNQITASLNEKQVKELNALMWFGQSSKANLGYAWHLERYQSPLNRPADLSAATLRRGLFRLRAETRLVYSAA